MSDQNTPKDSEELNGTFELGGSEPEKATAPTPTPEVEAPKEEAPKPQVQQANAGPRDAKEPTYTLGDYKNLAHATRFRIDGVERPLYGRAKFDFNPYKQRSDLDKTRTPFAVPSLGFAGVAHGTEAIQRLNFRSDAQARTWAETVDSSTALNCVNDAFMAAMNRQGSKWEQVPEHGGSKLVAAMATQPNHENKELKDSAALVYAMAALNLGTPVQSPMWHSGFWVSFRPASEDAWINFNDRISSDKIRIGRNSSGLSFSNINAIFTERALEFALDHMLDHNIRMEAGTSRRDIFKKLRSGDIPAFLWAFLMANYPSGYPISRACSAAIGNCTEVLHETLNLRILQVTDTSVLDEKQRNHMAKKYSNAVTEQEVEEYQSSLSTIQPREITILENSNLTLRATVVMPTAEDYILSGHRWFDGIVKMVDEILAKNATDRQREQTYQNYAKASVMREYSHWIKEIHLNSNVVKDLESLENLLTELTPHGDVRKKFYKTISDYIESSVMSVVGIPNYACPACGESQKTEKEGDRFVDCIPLDVAEAFFNLALLRMLEISSR